MPVDWRLGLAGTDMVGAVERGFEAGRANALARARDRALVQLGSNPADENALGALLAADPSAWSQVMRAQAEIERARRVSQGRERAPYYWNWQGGAFMHDPESGEVRVLREPSPIPQMRTVDEGDERVTYRVGPDGLELVARAPRWQPAREGTGGGSGSGRALTANQRAAFLAEAARARAAGVPEEAIRQRLRELGVQ